MTNEEIQEILSELRAQGTDITELPTVSNLYGVVALPCLKNGELVNVEIAALSAGAENAAKQSADAAELAKNAAKTAASSLQGITALTYDELTEILN